MLVLYATLGKSMSWLSTLLRLEVRALHFLRTLHRRRRRLRRAALQLRPGHRLTM